MKEKQVKLPGPDHPISIQRSLARVVVSEVGHELVLGMQALKRSGRPDEVADVIALLGCTKQ